MTKALDILTLVVLWLIVSATASSCRSGHEPGRDGDTDGSRISFKFTIYTEDTPQSTRALGVWEEDAANVAERILNADDMRILFFDQSGRLLKSVRPSDVDYVGSDVTNDGYYTVSASFTHEYFDNFDDNANIAFTVMILANLEESEADTPTILPATPSCRMWRTRFRWPAIISPPSSRASRCTASRDSTYPRKR